MPGGRAGLGSPSHLVSSARFDVEHALCVSRAGSGTARRWPGASSRPLADLGRIRQSACASPLPSKASCAAENDRFKYPESVTLVLV
ncbi:hypothetical protein SETIT_6G217900v2 [Setaria italica]|uniref:Uncharacterized protein n=1 Tax=Setaria italica TaxID=4555 RepID=A0A368RP59_SETIT|nr:hypothetical protein SETIT_6G217900v2 [Setaria italica]